MLISIMIINLILTATLLVRVCFKGNKKETLPLYYDDGTPAKFYITGDKHRNFERVVYNKAFIHNLFVRNQRK